MSTIIFMMREKKLRTIVTFYTTAEAVACERTCKGIIEEGRLMPAPRSVSADCGIAYRADAEKREQIQTILEDKGIEYQGIYVLETY